jgi:hypothetical protein
MHQSAFLIPSALLLAIPLHNLGMKLAVLPPIARMLVAPLAWTLQTYLPVDGISSNLSPVIVATTLSLTVGMTANELVRAIAGRLKRVVAVATAVIAHRAAPDRDVSRSL